MSTNTKRAPLPLGVRLAHCLRVLKLWELGHPKLKEADDACMIVRSLISHDPHVQDAARERVALLENVAAWCRECGFQWVTVPIIAKCEQCGGRQLAKGPK